MGNQKQTAELLAKFSEVRGLLTAIGDETRQCIIAALADGRCEGMRVGKITERTHLSRPAVSHHLKILLNEGVIGVVPKGTMNFYHLKLGGAWPSLVALVNQLERLGISKEKPE